MTEIIFFKANKLALNVFFDLIAPLCPCCILGGKLVYRYEVVYMEWSASKFFQIAFPYFSKTGKGLPLVFRLEAYALADLLRNTRSPPRRNGSRRLMLEPPANLFNSFLSGAVRIKGMERNAPMPPRSF